MANNQKFPLLTTPFGESEWAYLVTPDTKFNELGDYKVNLIVPGDAEDTKDFLDKVVAIRDQFFQQCVEEAAKNAKGGRKPKEVKLSEFKPWEELEDGRIVLKLKRKAKIIDDKGETKEFTVDIVDARGNVVPPEKKTALNIGNGSIMRSRVEIIPYQSPMQGVGVSFRLRDVQIKTLVKYQSNAFDAVDVEEGEGFVYDMLKDGDAGAGYGSAGTDDTPQYHV